VILRAIVTKKHAAVAGVNDGNYARWPPMLDFRMASVDQKWTFTRYWLSILGRIPALFWRSANRVRTVAAVLIMLTAALSRQWGKLLNDKWQGIPRKYVLVLIGVGLLWGVMEAIYERDAELMTRLDAFQTAATGLTAFAVSPARRLH
jgi:hypothetical protein